MTHRYVRIACSGRLTIARPEANTALNAEEHDAVAAKRASVWTAL